MGQHNSLWARWELGHLVSPLIGTHTPLTTKCAADVTNIASVEAQTILEQNPPSAAASKHTLLGPTKATASDYAQHGIRINAVSPSGIRRRRSPMVYATSSRTAWCANFWASPPAQSQKRATCCNPRCARPGRRLREAGAGAIHRPPCWFRISWISRSGWRASALTP
ncbi:MAG: SDR family oxidoreductase [Mycobacterium sp.]|uniref:SDR family oxidoreductase n=1 Tax=Mycobacterium sp. TaxID=1785 RepID=UPI003F9E5110